MSWMKDTLADSFRVAVEGGDVVIEFGQSRDPSPERAGRTIALSDRVMLPPVTVKRLVCVLHDLQLRHAPAGAPEPVAESPAAPAPAAGVSMRGQVPVNAPADPAGEKGALLLKLVSDLGIPYQYERSFRISEASLQANRFLLSVERRDMANDPLATALAICRRLDMPAAAQAAAERNFEMANCLHFGFEGDGDSIVCKLYFERAVPPEEAARARAGGAPVPLHLAFKWDLVRNSHVVTRYNWYPATGLAELESRLSQVYRDTRSPASLEIACEALRLAAGKVPAERLQYLEVEEDENDRRSFDLNLYDAQLQVKDLQPLFYRMREHFGVRPGQFQALYDQIRLRTMGHLAGGVHRDGKDFFNVYYGAAGFPQFSGRFR